MKFLYKQKRNHSSDSNFFDPVYQKHNIARLSHLDSLGLSLSNKKVLELGAGIGDHTLFYLYRGCSVTPVEGRQALCDLITKRFAIDAVKIDFEYELNKLANYRSYEIVHCYGLLYHLSNPAEFLNHACKTGDLFLLETCVSTDDSSDPINIVDESASDFTQAISGKGCRPTRKWLFDELKKHYEYVYMPTTQPNHIEFALDLRKKQPEMNLTRAIFIASKHKLENLNLIPSIPEKYRSLDEKSN